MIDPNPYEAIQSSSLSRRYGGTRKATGFLVTGSILLGIASYLFFFSQSFTFYTPYSVETHWILSLPSGSDYAVHSYIGLTTMLVCFLVGSILVLSSIPMLIRHFITATIPK